MSVKLKNSNWFELLLWILRLRWRFRVTGASMSPLLAAGDEVLVNPVSYWYRRPKPGDIVVARHPYRTDVKLVKLVRAVRADGHCVLAGLNPTESTDSRAFGAVPPQRILGRVTSRFG